MYSRAGLILALCVACGGSDTPHDHSDAPTYYGEAKAVMDASCNTCHTAGGIAPIAFDTLEEITPYAALIRQSVDEGTMPPWQGGEDCNEYSNDFSLSDADKATLMDWIDAGTPEGDPADEVPHETASAFPIDLLVTLPEAYKPQSEPDDYRCQLIPWPETETTFVTGLRVEPDQDDMVHHTIVYAVSADVAETYYALDDADDGPGYTCFGGPNGEGDNPFEDMTTEDLMDLMNGTAEGPGPMDAQRWIGAWVPGVAAQPFPAGTGLRMEPGDLLVVQMHYNTDNTDPAGDQSSVGFQLATDVEREATVQPLTNLGWVTELDLLGGPMTIPEGAASTVHSTTIPGSSMIFSAARGSLGLDENAPLMVHTAGHHMHQLGRTGRQELQRANGEDTCLIDIPDWDFHWQGNFALAEPVVMNPEDAIFLSCDFDNSQENQPIIDGKRIQTREVAWGEGSTDEMCLSTLYLTAQ